MTYIDGFVIAVPAGNRDKFINHARTADPVFVELGATRVLECWEDDVPDGKRTDFRRAVEAQDGEKVVFSWIEWPDKATRDVAMAKMTEMMNTDPRMDPAKNPMPFDGARMIFGGFAPMLDEGGRDGAYVDGFLAAVSEDGRDAYLEHARKAAPIFAEYGATRVVEAWGDDVPNGKRTDFRRAVEAGDGERVVFSWIAWPNKETRDAGWAKMMGDERMAGPMPFDGARMVYGGFRPVVEL